MNCNLSKISQKKNVGDDPESILMHHGAGGMIKEWHHLKTV